MNTFPFRRLTIDQIVALFQVYHIHLGRSESDRIDIIQAIQKLDRDKFEIHVKELLDRAKSLDSVMVENAAIFQQLDGAHTSSL